MKSCLNDVDAKSRLESLEVRLAERREPNSEGSFPQRLKPAS